MKILKTNDSSSSSSSSLPWQPVLNRGPYETRRKGLGGEKLTAGLWEVAAGKRSFPMHVHSLTEEAMYVVSGRGKVRSPDGETPIEPGDYVLFAPNGTAHQIEADASGPLVFLAMSAVQGVDLVYYPQSDKYGVSLGTPASGGKRFLFREKDAPDYFDGEE